MINNKTIFILGAGTSIPYGYPSGNELVEKVQFAAANSSKVFFSNAQEIEKAYQFANDLYKSDSSSIDLFLEKRPEFLNIGKLFISSVLLSFENPNEIFKFKNRNNGIYHYIFNNMISGGCQFKDFRENKISFITFNYDRSLEFFFFESLKHTYGKSDEETKNEVEYIPIIHMHGSLGPLPWQNEKGIPYLSRENKQIKHLARYSSSCLSIISEISSIKKENAIAKRLILEASHIYFLGFGFHNENLNNLGLEQIKLIDENLSPSFRKGITNYNFRKSFRGTSLGLGIAEVNAIQEKWKIFLPDNKLDSLGFIKEYGIFL